MDYIKYNNTIAKKTKYDGYYVTECGCVISVKIKGGQGAVDYNNPRLHCTKTDKDGYLEVCLSIIQDKKHKRIYKRVHRLIWETFNGEICDDLTIDHINMNKKDNRLSNLRLLPREVNTSIALKNKKSPKRFIYKLYLNNKFLGYYDRNSLQLMLNINHKDWYKKEKLIKLQEKGFRIEQIVSVEDIEKVS